MRVAKVAKIVAMVMVFCVVAGFVVMELWNWLMPALFGLKAVTFLQAIGLVVLSKILMGGFHRHGHGGGRFGGGGGWKQHMEERWGHMSPEEREKLRAGFRGRWGCEPRTDSAPEGTK